jgi:hypothetical protein
MRSLVTTCAVLCAVVIGLALSSAAAEAASCRGGGVSWHGDRPARFSKYTALDGMNCASVRYVMDRWVRRQFRRTGLFRRTFYDGYVTWHGRKIRPGRFEYREFESHTRLRFTARYI